MRPNPPTPDEAARLELEHHIAERAERLIAEGWPPEDAQAEARRRLGDLDGYRRSLARSTRETATREARRRVRLDVLADLRLTLRSVRRRPGFFATAVFALAVGLGANSAVFSVVKDVLLDPPPFDRPEELVLVWSRLTEVDGRRIPTSGPDVERIRESVDAFRSLSFVGPVRNGSLGEPGSASHVRVGRASSDLFSTLGLEPAAGRWFGPALPGDSTAIREVVLSWETFRRAFAGDVAKLGRTALLNGQPVVPVGVLPAGFELRLPPEAGIPSDPDLWVALPESLELLRRAAGRRIDQDTDNAGAVIGRLSGGLTVDEVRDPLHAAAARLREEVQEYAEAGLTLEVAGLWEDSTAYARPILVAVYGGVGALILLVWLNLATLWLGRMSAAESDIRVRMALGAHPARVATGYAVDLGVVLVVGGVLGWAIAAVTTPVLAERLGAEFGPVAPRFGAGVYHVGLWAATAAVLLALHFVRFGVEAADGPGRGGRVTGSRLRRGLIVAQVGAAVVLVTSSGLLARSARSLAEVDPGFEADGAWVFGASLRVPGAHRSPSDRARVVQEITFSLEELPGVTRAGVSNREPFVGRSWTQPWGPAAESESEWSVRRADFRTITSGYFDALGIRTLEGRSFTTTEDRVENERVVVVDERIAESIEAGGSVLGREIGFPLDGSAVRARIVGVVESVRYDGLRLRPRGSIYVPYRQEASRDVVFFFEAEAPPARADVEAAVAAVAPLVPVYGLRPLEEIVAREVVETRALVRLIGLFALFGLFSAAVGLYGLLSFEVARRTREVGIRIALGAATGRVLRAVVVDGLRLTGFGLVLGAVGAVASGRVLATLVHGVTPADPLTWLSVSAVFAAVAVSAAWFPARRAASADPTEALRAE